MLFLFVAIRRIFNLFHLIHILILIENYYFFILLDFLLSFAQPLTLWPSHSPLH